MALDELTLKDLQDIFELFKSTAACQSPAAPVLAQTAANNLDDFAIGEYVIIRTYSAGVWCGKLLRKAGNEVILTHARRMWFWKCAKSISLSGIVMYGIDQTESKIAPNIPKVWLEAIEIMPIEGEPLKSIMEAPYAQA